MSFFTPITNQFGQQVGRIDCGGTVRDNLGMDIGIRLDSFTNRFTDRNRFDIGRGIDTPTGRIVDSLGRLAGLPGL